MTMQYGKWGIWSLELIKISFPPVGAWLLTYMSGSQKREWEEMSRSLFTPSIPSSFNEWSIGGLRFWECRWGPKNNNPFHKGIPKIQSTGPQTTADSSIRRMGWIRDKSNLEVWCFLEREDIVVPTVYRFESMWYDSKNMMIHKLFSIATKTC